ncbi:MAG: hypothetical protein HOP18_09335 [Deltaproteobacteria bacterium]|nr:hypothetical protein [Deltaproteobacteria bacterium]
MSALHRFVLALAPVSRGFGLFVVDVAGKAIDWRVREIRDANHRNAKCQVAADQLLDEFRPEVLVIEDHRAPGSRRHPRIQELLDLFAELGVARGLNVVRYGIRDVRVALRLHPKANKHKIAEAVAKQFPALERRLPKPKRIWETEAHAMAMFQAGALALTYLAARSA